MEALNNSLIENNKFNKIKDSKSKLQIKPKKNKLNNADQSDIINKLNEN